MSSLCFSGCSNGTATAPPPASNELGKSIQASVTTLIADLQKSPKQAAERLKVARESFDSYAESYQGKFVAVAKAAKELQEQYEHQASQTELEASQARLQQAADEVAK